ncbi:MAG: UDP-3-O-acyl-N-acetylglucosamine deacetylase [Myxococcota bacterium]
MQQIEQVQQSTIRRRISCRGIGLHSGEEVEITLCPAPAETGIVFVSLAGGEGEADVEIPACLATVHSSSRSTTLSVAASAPPPNGDGSRRVATVEHLLATIFALEIDNLRIEVSGSEIPVMDGSAAPFVDWLRTAGRRTQAATRRVFTLEDRIEIRDGDRLIRIEPAEELRISYAIDFDHPCIGRQSLEIARLDEKIFEGELASARTFGFVHEVKALHEAGLALGGGMENAIILDEERVLNQDGLRWSDEFVRHKIVDLLGDLALLGARPRGHIQVERGGHRLHHRLVAALLNG